MDRYLSDTTDESRHLLAAVDAKTAVEVGGVPPCAEMKGLGWRVFWFDGHLYALACTFDHLYGWGYECSASTLSDYTEDTEEAAHRLAAIVPGRADGKGTP